jgi:hypothetical protein
MKAKLSLNSPLISLALICSFTASVLPGNAVSSEAPRWFEIEVIFFKQLGDKNLLKEQFVDNELPNYSRSFDLLTPYLQPDISSLKQQLPYCNDQYTIDDKVINKLNIKKETRLADFIETRTLAEIEDQSNITNDNQQLNNKPELNRKLNKESLDTVSNEIADLPPNLNSGLSSDLSSNLSSGVNSSLTTEQRHLIPLAKDAEQYFTDKKFQSYSQYPSFDNKEICQIAKSYFQQTLPTEKLNSFNYNGFPVDAVPRLINGIHKDNTTQPYLISKGALRLGDITKRLRWSKRFKPLLHLGWRQIGVTRNKAIPMKVYAGDNLAQQYQKSFDSELSSLALKSLLQEQQSTIDSEMNIIDVPESGAQDQFLQQKDRQVFDEIFSKIDNINQESLAPLLTKLNNPSYDFMQDEQKILSKAENILENSANTVENSSKLIKPIQPWLLDGFLKVHLDHYLYVTADFNMVTQETVKPVSNFILSADEQRTDKSLTLTPETREKVIHFSQDRRIISGEVHYLDHPYIGIVIQIRRFDPTKPENEAVSQNVN